MDHSNPYAAVILEFQASTQSILKIESRPERSITDARVIEYRKAYTDLNEWSYFTIC